MKRHAKLVVVAGDDWKTSADSDGRVEAVCLCATHLPHGTYRKKKKPHLVWALTRSTFFFCMICLVAALMNGHLAKCPSTLSCAQQTVGNGCNSSLTCKFLQVSMSHSPLFLDKRNLGINTSVQWKRIVYGDDVSSGGQQIS